MKNKNIKYTAPSIFLFFSNSELEADNPLEKLGRLFDIYYIFYKKYKILYLAVWNRISWDY